MKIAIKGGLAVVIAVVFIMWIHPPGAGNVPATARIQGITYWIQVAYLTVPAFVGLNPQVPVASQTVIDTFLGLIFGIWIAFVVGRQGSRRPISLNRSVIFLGMRAAASSQRRGPVKSSVQRQLRTPSSLQTNWRRCCELASAARSL